VTSPRICDTVPAKESTNVELATSFVASAFWPSCTSRHVPAIKPPRPVSLESPYKVGPEVYTTEVLLSAMEPFITVPGEAVQTTNAAMTIPQSPGPSRPDSSAGIRRSSARGVHMATAGVQGNLTLVRRSQTGSDGRARLKLNRKKEQAIAALLTRRSVEDAAETAGHWCAEVDALDEACGVRRCLP
jgi:hypothetical protein